MQNPEGHEPSRRIGHSFVGDSNRHELDDLALASANGAELVAELQRLHGFTDERCGFVVTSSARVLTQQYRNKIAAEREEVLKDLRD